MNLSLPMRASACPGLYRLAPARDGGICRVKLDLGTMTAAEARALAAAAQRFGNGIVEITNRANLQLRGIAESDAEALADTLVAAGLGAPSPGADDVRNVMVSPAYGLDPAAMLDAGPLARQVLALLAGEPRYHLLSPKFSILVDGGEALAPPAHAHDLWLAALGDGRLAFGLAGSPADGALATLPVAHGLDLVAAILDFLVLKRAARLRDLAADDRQALLATLGARLPLQETDWRRLPASGAPLGVLPQRGGAMVGGRPVLGRLDPAALLALAHLAQAHGDGTLRLTPWQSVLLPQIRDAVAVETRLRDLGLVIDPRAAAASLIACSGATGCRSALADTQADAKTLVGLVDQPGLHLSGCEKSCASASQRPVTLVAVAPGRYDLYRGANDQAGRFGMRLGDGLSLAQAAAVLAAKA
ncbi:MAG TPA: precorrin-3B synthase [Devosiaceae bacterium]